MLKYIQRFFYGIWDFLVQFRKWFLAILLFFCLIAASIALLLNVYEKDVKQLLVVKLNNNLATSLATSGIDLSFFSTFPYASVTFNGVVLSGSQPYESDTVLLADRIDFKFGLFDLFSKNMKINAIAVEGGKLFLRTDSEKQINYKVWKSDSTASIENSLNIELKSIEFKHVDFVYSDAYSKFYASGFTPFSKFKADFSNDKFNVESNSQWQVRSIKSSQTTWLSSRPLVLNTSFFVDSKADLIHFEQSAVAVSETRFLVSGDYKWGNASAIDLQITTDNSDLKALLSLLPPEYDNQIEQFKSNGKVDFKCLIRGALVNDLVPVVDVDFNVSNAELINRKSNIEMKSIFATGQYTYANNDSKLNLKQFKCTLPNGRASGWIVLSSFKKRLFKGKIEGDLDLNELLRFSGSSMFNELSGKLSINVDFNGKTAEKMKAADWWKSVTANGRFQLTNARLKLNDFPTRLNRIDLRGTFNRQNLDISDLNIETDKSKAHIKGTLSGIFPFLFEANAQLILTADLDAQKIDVDEWLNGSSEGKSDAKPAPIFINLKGKVNKLTYKKFNASDLNGEVIVKPDSWTLRSVKCATMGGTVLLNGSITELANGNFIDCIAELTKIDINQLFLVCENFGQEVLTSKHIKGLGSTKVSFTAKANRNFDIDENSVSAIADVMIEQGELVSFKPLESLSRFVSLDELKNIRFSTLKNTIKISDKKIFIPAMELSNNALNMTVSGVHQFSNVVDYKIQLALNDVLFNKARKNKRENEEFGEIADDGLGRSKLLLSMSGPIENAKFSYDAKGVKKKIQEDVKKDTKNVKDLLNEEFKLWKKKDTVKTQKDKKKKDDVIEVEWE